VASPQADAPDNDDTGNQLLAFINTVRGIQERDHIGYLIYLDADADDPEGCILSQAKQWMPEMRTAASGWARQPTG
jgi:hypothetical protein